MKAPLYPIEIVGGGLAGLSLGVALRRADVPVTLYEAGNYPRHRVCGEFITGLEEETIEQLGLGPLLADTARHQELAWFIDGVPTRTERLPQPALGLSRYLLDTRLADVFLGLGGDLRVGTRITDPTPIAGRVFATGRRRARSDWIGLKFHVGGIAPFPALELHLGDDAYVGLSRIENDLVNVCGLFRRRPLRATGAALLLSYLEASGLSSLAERLRRAPIDPASFCAVAGLQFDRRGPAALDRICLGDACATIPPFTGNGMAMAFQSAAIALGPLIHYARGESTWNQTLDATNAALRGRFRVRLASADVLHPFLLRPQRQRWFAALSRARLLPFRPLYAALH